MVPWEIEPTNHTNHIKKDYTVPSKSIRTARPIPLFLQYTEYIWGSQEFSISAFISWYLHLDALNYLEHSTFGISPPNFYVSKSIETEIKVNDS